MNFCGTQTIYNPLNECKLNVKRPANCPSQQPGDSNIKHKKLYTKQHYSINKLFL